jgi:hypothetical protein
VSSRYSLGAVKIRLAQAPAANPCSLVDTALKAFSL